jgi:hypothetical protein
MALLLRQGSAAIGKYWQDLADVASRFGATQWQGRAHALSETMSTQVDDKVTVNYG